MFGNPSLDPSWAQLGPSWAHLGANLAPSWGQLGPSWPILVPPWPIFAPSWLILAPSWPNFAPKFEFRCGKRPSRPQKIIEFSCFFQGSTVENHGFFMSFSMFFGISVKLRCKSSSKLSSKLRYVRWSHTRFACRKGTARISDFVAILGNVRSPTFRFCGDSS